MHAHNGHTQDGEWCYVSGTLKQGARTIYKKMSEEGFGVWLHRWGSCDVATGAFRKTR